MQRVSLQDDFASNNIANAAVSFRLKNAFLLAGEVAVLFCPDKRGTLHEVLIDTDNLYGVLAFGFWRIVNASKNVAKPLYYAYASNGTGRKTTIHRFLLNPPAGVPVDHRNHETLDNRTDNLRLTNHSLNALNQRRGADMCVYKRQNRFQVRVEINQVQRFLGSFISEQAAKDCRDEFLRTQGVQI